MKVDQSLVDPQLKAIPGLGTFTAGRFAGSDAQNFGRETDWALHTELLILGPVDEVRRELLQVLDIAAGEGDPDFVDFGSGDGGAGSVVFFFTLSDVTHGCFDESEGD